MAKLVGITCGVGKFSPLSEIPSGTVIILKRRKFTFDRSKSHTVSQPPLTPEKRNC
jgi:hypothetical protein